MVDWQAERAVAAAVEEEAGEAEKHADALRDGDGRPETGKPPEAGEQEDAGEQGERESERGSHGDEQQTAAHDQA